MKFYAISIIMHLLLFVFFYSVSVCNRSLSIEEKELISISLNNFKSNMVSQEEISNKPEKKEKKVRLNDNVEKFQKTEEILKDISKSEIISTKEEDSSLNDNEIKSSISEKKEAEKVEESNENFTKINESLLGDNSLFESKENIKENTFDEKKMSENKKNQEEKDEKKVESLVNSNEKIIENQNMKGLVYKILYNPDPKYPSLAKRLNLEGEIEVTAKFLVNSKGVVEKVEIQKRDNYGFSEEVEKTLKKWKFSSIEYNGEKVSFYFYKKFKFRLEK
ncbi:MAG: energy transducer TonB [Fusobacteriaceae bacterium]|nr:energy transducer TonB [Fusobacteriaceae bacterium]